jgi:exopolyphosphatase / guanosine-5'-triphosphate,3'-diphosphate pyrophosphatase
MRVGIVDLGTNSVRFAIYQPGRRPARPECIYKKKLMLRPGQGVFSTGKLKKSTIRRLTLAFQKFSRQAEREGVENVLAVATSALREARNAKELLTKVERKSGIRIRIISGRREAQLIANGILAFERPRRGPFVLIDIGGGSTEVSFCRDHKRLRSLSLQAGALRLQQLYMPLGAAEPINERLNGLIKMKWEIHKILVRHLGRKPRSVKTAIGSSGTIRALARLIDRRHAHNTWVLRDSRRKPRLSFHRSELKDLIDHMLVLNRAELGRLPGMERRRIDIILCGGVFLLELMEFIGTAKIVTTNFALRDGLILEAFRPLRPLKNRKRP